MNSLSRPVKPRAASIALLVPMNAPQPVVSFVIAGSLTARGISAIGAWYSAMPMAWRSSSSPRPSSRPTLAATPRAPHDADAWYCASRSWMRTPARSATS